MSHNVLFQRREDGREEATTFFKGIIMDIRLSNRNGVERIVKLFDLQLVGNDTQPNIEESLGNVTAHDIEEGTVSDDTCQVEPCQNGGKCKVTWNDYQCQCEAGYKGGDCEELEYCHWYKCPADSTCRSLNDGHECITNATFDGLTTRITYSASFEQPSVLSNSISARFRSQAGGPLLSLTGANGQQVMLSVVGGNSGSLEVILVEGSEEGNLTFGGNLADGDWHKVTMEIREAIGDISVKIDDKEEEFEDYSNENSTIISLAQFVSNAEVVVGSGGRGQDIDFFRGCMQEVRIGGVLLPFFTEDELVNSTAGQKFEVQQRGDITKGECVLCYQAECQNGGSCYDPSDKFQCKCPAGFAGPVCEENIDKCLKSECENGECRDGVNNYTCECKPGWTGTLCKEDLDECETQPCQHGGTCTQTLIPGDYTCACLNEYKGKDCQELKVKTCREAPCENGGTCIEEDNRIGPEKYRCDCLNGYEGINCQNQTDYCVKLAVECQNGGTCVSDFSSFNFECLCQPGFTKEKCQEEIDECASNPCLHGGNCIDMVNGFRCECDGTGFSGQTCSENIDECLANPCEHGSRCNDTLGSFSCLCSGTAKGFCGQRCHVADPCKNVSFHQIKFLPCLGIPIATLHFQEPKCLNEGVCMQDCDSEVPYKCSCPEGWEGRTCNLKVSYFFPISCWVVWSS